MGQSNGETSEEDSSDGADMVEYQPINVNTEYTEGDKEGPLCGTARRPPEY